MVFNINYVDIGLFGVYVLSDNIDGFDDIVFVVMREF